ncbi:hypothetical protein OPQ81_006837 [Rhizoctonia solani]|nr:hypothetical protein OPQ81_006837 [Rhizoctonia solani]
MEVISFIFMLRANTLDFAYASGSVVEVLGREDDEIISLGITDLLHDEEREHVVEALRGAVRQNKAARLVYLQLLHAQQHYVVCQMAISVAGNVIVGSICPAQLAIIGSTPRDQSAEDVIVTVTNLIDYPGMVGYSAVNWTGTRFPRTALLLDRFSRDLTITHCTNNAILDNDTCVQRSFYRYVAARDEDSVRSFISSMRQSVIGGHTSMNLGFVYHTFTLCVAPGAPTSTSGTNEVRVSAVGIATSDGFILVLKLES